MPEDAEMTQIESERLIRTTIDSLAAAGVPADDCATLEKSLRDELATLFEHASDKEMPSYAQVNEVLCRRFGIA